MGVTVEQAWAIAADTAGLKEAAERFKYIEDKAKELEKELEETVVRLAMAQGELATAMNKAGANVGGLSVRAGWLSITCAAIGALDEERDVATFSTLCDDRHAEMLKSWQGSNSAVTETTVALGKQADKVSAVVERIGTVRRRVEEVL